MGQSSVGYLSGIPLAGLILLIRVFFCITPQKEALQPSYREIIQEHQPG